MISIGEVELGDYVLAYDEATGETGYYPVTAVWSHEDPVTVDLTIDGEIIETTPEHPFYTDDEEWIPAGELNVGDEIYQSDGSTGTVESVVFIVDSQEMYNLTVDEAHTFFVGEGQWLVHNECPDLVRARNAKELSHIANRLKIKLLDDLNKGKKLRLTIGVSGGGEKPRVVVGTSDESLYYDALRHLQGKYGQEYDIPNLEWVPNTRKDPNLNHAERILYSLDPDVREIGISNPDGPCPFCGNFFKDKDVYIGYPTRFEPSDYYNVSYKGDVFKIPFLDD